MKKNNEKLAFIARTFANLLFCPLYIVFCLVSAIKFFFKNAGSYAKMGLWKTHGQRFKPLHKKKIDGVFWTVPDTASFYQSFLEIMEEYRIYDFLPTNISPVIIDAGANVGVSALFFKKQFPSSIVEAFEADPQIYTNLLANLHDNGINDVLVHNCAIWHKNTMLYFEPDGADGGHLVEHKSVSNNIFPVNAIDLREVLHKYKKIDILKMDIEGAENVLIPYLDGELENVERLFIEYHHSHDAECRLPEMLMILRKNGFQYRIHNLCDSYSPFLENRKDGAFFQQLNIFAFKEQR